MINKGKGCIVAIFKGLNPINTIKHGLDNVFIKKEEPLPKGYVTDGLIIHFSGEDKPIDGKWVDRIIQKNTSLTNSPTYDSTNKCYSFNGINQYGTFTMTDTTGGDFTLEVYYKQDEVGPFDVRVGNNRSTSRGFGIVNDNGTSYAWIYSTSELTLPTADRPIQVAGRKTYTRLSRETATMHFDLIDGVQKVNRTFEGVSDDLRVSGYRMAYSGNDANKYSKCQIYSIRLYNRKLTDEEIAQNYAEDVRIYGE